METEKSSVNVLLDVTEMMCKKPKFNIKKASREEALHRAISFTDGKGEVLNSLCGQ